MRSRSRPLLIPALAFIFLCPPLVSVPSLRADDGKIKQSLKEAGEGIKSLGKKVGEKSAEVAKRIWYKGKQVSAPLLHNVQRSTRKFWDETIRGKDKSIDALRGENAKLKKELDEGED